MLELQQYAFTPMHRAGKTHINADSLSRLVTEEDGNMNKVVLSPYDTLMVANALSTL